MYHSTILIFCVLVGRIHSVNIQPRIVGGTAATINEFPYLVSVMAGGVHVCGGCILDANTVITAAHCLDNIPAASITVRAGSSLRASGGTIGLAQRTLLHPRFNRNTLNYDLGLIHLTANLPVGATIQPIQIYTQQLYGGWIVKTAGWGATRENGPLQSTMRKTSLRILSRRACQRIYGTLLANTIFCAGWLNGGIDTCNGDAGGPLVYNNQLVGVASIGNGCARRGFPGLNSKVPMNANWILNNLN